MVEYVAKRKVSNALFLLVVAMCLFLIDELLIALRSEVLGSDIFFFTFGVLVIAVLFIVQSAVWFMQGWVKQYVKKVKI